MNIKLVILFFFSLVFAKEKCDTSKEYFWEIEGKNNKVYLLGSIHFGKADFYPFSSVIEKAFTSSDFLVLEADPNSPEAMQVALEMMQKSMFPADTSLKMILPIDLYTSLLEEAKKHKIPEQVFSKLRPWALMLMLTQMEMMKQGFNPQDGVEQYFISKMKKEQNIVELESIKMQTELLQTLDPIPLLQHELQQNKNAAVLTDSMVTLWKCGEGQKLMDLMFEGMDQNNPAVQSFLDDFLYNRNQNMAKKIKALTEESKDYFVVVGAAHLAGLNSIQSYLRKYSIEAVQK